MIKTLYSHIESGYANVGTIVSDVGSVIVKGMDLMGRIDKSILEVFVDNIGDAIVAPENATHWKPERV